MINLKKYIFIVLIIGAMVVIIPFFLILYQFSTQSLSTEIIHWGSFGDYISGTTGTIISLLNLVLLIVLTIYVSKFDMHRHFNEFRYISFINLCEKIDNNKGTSKSYIELIEFIESFKSRNYFAYSEKDFTDIKAKANELIFSIKPIIKILTVRERERQREKVIIEGSKKELVLSDEDKNYFSFLFAESINNDDFSENDFTEYEYMKIKRNQLLELIQTKMKFN